MHSTKVVIVLAALAAWIFGAIWYGVLGKVWQRAQGLDPEQCKGQKMPLAPMAVSFACELVMAVVLLHILRRAGVEGWPPGAYDGLLIGIGFMATTTLVNNMFQRRKLMLSLIDGVHWIGVAVIEGVVLVKLI